MSKNHSIAVWLEHEELPDLYTLLGKRRLDPDVDSLKAAVNAAARQLMPYQNHADAGKAQRAMNMLMQLGRVEGLLSDERRLAEVNKQLLSDLMARGVTRFGDGAAQWTSDAVRAWLEDDEQVSPAAMDEALVAVCSALRPPEVALKAVRVFAAQPSAAPGMPEIIPVALFCPECRFSVAGGAVICIACGYDFRTGQRIVSKTSRSSSTIRPPSGAKARSRTAKTTRETATARGGLASHAWLAKVGFAAAVGLVVLISGGVWLVTTRDRAPGGSGDEATVAAVDKKANVTEVAPPEQLMKAKVPASNESSLVNPFAGGPKKSEAAELPMDASASMPSEDVPSSPADTAEAKRAFDRAYKKAVGASPADFDRVWERALQLAPNAESRCQVHATKIAELIKGPTPMSSAALEQLCAAYDLVLADAQNVGERLSGLESLVFAMRQKKSVEPALVRYASLRRATSGDEVRDTVIRRLTQECFNGVAELPVGERWEACQRVIGLVGDDDATRLAAYRVLAADPAVMALLPLERLWEVFDLVLIDTPEGLLATSYVRALVDQVRRRGSNKEAVQHYQSLCQDADKQPFARRVLVALAQPQLAAAQSPPVAGPMGPPSPAGTRGPMMPGGPPVPGGSTLPGGPTAPGTHAAPTNSPPPDSIEEPDADIVKMQEYMRLLDDPEFCADAKADELEKMYEFVVAKAGDLVDVKRLASQVVTGLAQRKRKLVQTGINRYEKRLKRDKQSLTALYFLAEAYEWRANENVRNQQWYDRDMALCDEMRAKLAGNLPSKGKKSAASKRK